MNNIKTKQKTKIQNSKVKVGGLTKLKPKLKINKWLVIAVILIVSIFGVVLLKFSGAAPNNCQNENGAQICDVNETSGGSDTVLSIGPEADALALQGWGWAFSTAFRAPTSAYNGAIPVHRVINVGATWHDWVIDPQKRDKEAKYGALAYEGVAFYAWEHQIPGTVPVYRITQGGAVTKAFFTTDKSFVDKKIAESVNNPDGWKSGVHMPAVAFYAYPPNYAVSGQANPYDCSILVNFYSDRCKQQREALERQTAAGNIPKTNDCPKSLDTYLKAPFASQFTADCQKFWNTYMQDCSIQENYNSDRCKTQREAIIKANEEQIKARQKAINKDPKTQSSAKKDVGGKLLNKGINATNSVDFNNYKFPKMEAARNSSSAKSPQSSGVNVNWGKTMSGIGLSSAIGAVGISRDVQSSIVNSYTVVPKKVIELSKQGVSNSVTAIIGASTGVVKLGRNSVGLLRYVL